MKKFAVGAGASGATLYLFKKEFEESNKTENLVKQLTKYPQSELGFKTFTKDQDVSVAQKTDCLSIHNRTSLLSCQRTKTLVLELSKDRLIEETENIGQEPNRLKRINQLNETCTEAVSQGVVAIEDFHKLLTYNNREPILDDFLVTTANTNNELRRFASSVSNKIVEEALLYRIEGGFPGMVFEVLPEEEKKKREILLNETRRIVTVYETFNKK